jgi:MFS family permease
MAAQAIDLHEELAEAKVGKFHWRLGAIMGLLTLFDGYDTFNPAYVIHYVAKPWGLQAGQAGLLISSGLVGFLLGAAIHGIIADRLGRRGTLLGGCGSQASSPCSPRPQRTRSCRSASCGS